MIIYGSVEVPVPLSKLSATVPSHITVASANAVSEDSHVKNENTRNIASAKDKDFFVRLLERTLIQLPLTVYYKYILQYNHANCKKKTLRFLIILLYFLKKYDNIVVYNHFKRVFI